jgi:hypothetical protein
MNRLSLSSSPLNGSLNPSQNNLGLLSSANTSLRQVDFDEDVTPLYEAIGKSDWDLATSLISAQDAATWVVRYERDAQGNKLHPYRIIWRFLPIHSTCALNPPASFLRKLLSAYPDGPRTLDDQGLLPLHYACGARCCRETIYSLLMNFPQAALREDPNGMLPLHYLAQWGPDGKQGQINMGVLDMVLVSTGDKAANCDHDGNTVERLAMNAEYDGHLEVAKHIASFLNRKGLGNSVDPASSGSSISSTVEVIRTPKYKNNTPVLKINFASPTSNQINSHLPFNGDLAEEETVIEHAPEGNIETSLSMSARENANHNHIPRSFSSVQKQPPPSPYSTPKSGRKHRSFSWDEQGQNNAHDNFSISGSTWTTHHSNLPMSSPHRQTRQQTGFPPMSPRGSTSTMRVHSRHTTAQPETRQDDETGRGNQSFQSGSTNSTNTSYSSQLTQQLVEMAEIERREGLASPRGNRLESPRGNRALVPTPKNEKSASEALLLEEITRLRAEKERAEADLVQARGAHLGGMVGSIMGFSELSPIGEDDMSRLTTDEHEVVAEKQPTSYPSGENGAKLMQPVVSEIERLEMEREMIEVKLKKARAEAPIDPEEKLIQAEVKDDYKGLFEKEQNEHISTQNMLKEERKQHGEAIHSHLQEVKSLRESLERANAEIAKYQSFQSEKNELQRKELEWDAAREKHEVEIKHLKRSLQSEKNELQEKELKWDAAREKLEAEIKHLKQSFQSEKKELQVKELEWDAAREKLEAEMKYLKKSSSEQNHDGSDSSVFSTLTNISGLDSSVLRMQLESSVKEANELRKFSAAIRKEHNETISDLEDELERERTEKIKSLSKIVSLEYRISTLEEELEVERANKSNGMGKFASERIAELEADLEREISRKSALKQRISTLEKDMEKTISHKNGGGDIDRMAFEMHQLKRKLEEAERVKEILEDEKRELERKETSLCEQLDDALGQLDMAKKQYQALSMYQDTGDASDSHVQKIRDLKMRIRALEEADHSKLVKLREAEKVSERAIQEKEDECLEKIRQLKIEYEEKLQDKEDSHLKEMRDLKIKQENDFREKEESYLKDLRDAKKREYDLQDKEATLTKAMQEGKMKDSFFDLDVSKMIEEKENAFKEEVVKLTAEIEALRQESHVAADNALEAALLECKSELKSQSRKHRSELNKLKNALEMQKSKEARLEGHIMTMEKQIMDMIADYEDRIQQYLYGSIDAEEE